MKLSARNTIEGKIVSISMGPVTTDLVIETACGLQIGSSITTKSAQALGLEVGKKAYAVIKASSVMVGVDD
jgi:molybdopterin-binding protein